MLISAILAMASNGVMGMNNRLPWSLPTEMALFRKKTLDKHIIMGRSTAESLGRALPQRENFVISHNKCENLLKQGMFVFSSLESALEQAEREGAEESVIIGGSQIYLASIDYWQKLYLSEIEHKCTGDTFSPLRRNAGSLYLQRKGKEVELKHWQLLDEQHFPCDTRNAYPFVHSSWEKVRSLARCTIE